MKAYSTREVAELLGIPVRRVRHLAATGLMAPERTAGNHYLFSFQDLVLLRAAQGLNDAKVPRRRVVAALRALAAQLPPDRPLSAVRVRVEGANVVVRDNNLAWEPESGQTLLDFAIQEIGDKVAPLVRPAVKRAISAAETAEQWFAAALEAEQIGAASDAITAYRHVIEADSDHIAARINLGRLHHVARELEAAEQFYREALARDPQHPTARFNLGVVLEDRGAHGEAIAEYLEAARLDPRIADVHYNLARLYQQSGDAQAALRHFSKFKALTRPR